MDNTDLWLHEKQLERYAQEIKAYCESQNGCRGCYFGTPPKEDEVFPAWDCKFNSDNPGDWEVE